MRIYHDESNTLFMLYSVRRRTACDDGMEITVDCISSLNFYSSYCNSLISFQIKMKEKKNQAWESRKKMKTTYRTVRYYEFKEERRKYHFLPKLIFQSSKIIGWNNFDSFNSFLIVNIAVLFFNMEFNVWVAASVMFTILVGKKMFTKLNTNWKKTLKLTKLTTN